MVGIFFRYWLNDCRFTLAVRNFFFLMRLCTLITVLPGNGHVTSTFLKTGFSTGGLLYFCFVCCQKFPTRFFPSLKLRIKGYTNAVHPAGGLLNVLGVQL